MSDWSRGYYTWAPRKTAAQRRAEAARKLKDAPRGRARSPIVLAGRKIAQTFWGKAWCDNLERYRDFAYRLERGRSYLRSGSVLDLQIEAGKIAAEVLGSRLYKVAIEIDAVGRDAWRTIQRDCAGGVGSRIDLLSGRLSEPVMARLCAERTGLFPAPSAIRFTCSCPDYAVMCKHVAAVMYGIGARLDHAPDLLFTLRRVSLDDLLASAVTELPSAPSPARVLAAGGLASLFGIELADAPAMAPAMPAKANPTSRTGSKATPRNQTGATAKPRNRTGATAKPRNRTGATAKPTSRTGAKAKPTSRPAKAIGPLTPAVARIAKKVTQLAGRTSTQGKQAAASAKRPAERPMIPATPAPPARRRSG
jgi:uncharacterized Zn finger protein